MGRTTKLTCLARQTEGMKLLYRYGAPCKCGVWWDAPYLNLRPHGPEPFALRRAKPT